MHRQGRVGRALGLSLHGSVLSVEWLPCRNGDAVVLRMSSPEPWLRPRLWWAVPACALALVAWNSAAWIQRIDAVSDLPGRAHQAGRTDAPTTAGDTRVLRDLILPGGAG